MRKKIGFSITYIGMVAFIFWLMGLIVPVEMPVYFHLSVLVWEGITLGIAGVLWVWMPYRWAVRIPYYAKMDLKSLRLD